MKVADQAVYTCRVDYKIRPSAITKVNLTVIGETRLLDFDDSLGKMGFDFSLIIYGFVKFVCVFLCDFSFVHMLIDVNR